MAGSPAQLPLWMNTWPDWLERFAVRIHDWELTPKYRVLLIGYRLWVTDSVLGWYRVFYLKLPAFSFEAYNHDYWYERRIGWFQWVLCYDSRPGFFKTGNMRHLGPWFLWKLEVGKHESLHHSEGGPGVQDSEC